MTTKIERNGLLLNILRLRSRTNFGLIAVFLLVLLIYGKFLNLYFSQDDFFHLKISQTDGTIKEFLKLGTFRPFEQRGGIYFYRPIFREFLFNIYYGLFGLNALPFRLTQFAIHFVNITLVYIIFNFIFNRKTAALAGALFFAVAAANVGIISYLAGGIQVAGALVFYLSGVLSFIKYLKSKKTRYKILTTLFFLLALSSHELSVTLPAILFGLVWLDKGFSRNTLGWIIRELWFYPLIVLTYLFLEIVIIGFPTGESQYDLNLSPVKLINSYFWYFLWSLGTPEMLLDFVGPGIKLNPNLMRYWGSYFKVVFPTLFLILSFLLLSLKSLYKDFKFWFFVFWFVAGIFPVIFQPSHRLYYYLGMALIGTAGIIGLIFGYLIKKRKLLGFALLITFILLTIVSVELSWTNYWAITRANAAKNLIDDVANKYSFLPKGASVYFTNDPNHPYLNEEWGNSSKQASIILSGSDALQLVYKDPTLKVYYEDIKKPLKDEGVFSLRATIFKRY